MKIRIKHFFTAAVLVAFDQITKWYALQRGVCHFSSFFSCMPVFNKGIALSIASFHNPLFYYTLTSCIIVLYMYTLRFLTEHFYADAPYACMAIAAGGLANIIDRCVRGYVVDFIAFSFFSYDMPIFNIADVYITLGIVWLLIMTGAHYQKIAAHAVKK